jgi:hypothetical protein
MKIIFTNEEAQQHFHDAMCNGLGYIAGYDLKMRYNQKHYDEAKSKLYAYAKSKLRGGKGGALGIPEIGICYEDVLMQILRDGNELFLVDLNEATRHAITLQDVYDRLSKTPIRHLINLIEETDDAETADVMLQTIFLGEVVYG